jgi:predicted acetyltransferase
VGDEYELGPVGAGEVTAFLHANEAAFLADVHDEDVALWARMVEPDRTLVARSGGAIVATSGLFTMRLAVPGGVAPMAGVTAVGVDPVHRRRGLLDRLMRGHLAAVHERGDEALSALWALEAGIYGRWGFGQATRVADLHVRSADARLLAGPAPGRLRAGSPPELLPELRAVYAAVQPSYPGLIARDDVMWEARIADFEHLRDGFGQLRALATDGGYALYAVRKQDADGRPDDEIRLRELIAATSEARAVLWDHLLGLSLTRSVSWPLAPEDEPLPHMLRDSRAVRAPLGDALYVRLVDLARALAQRSYSAPVDVVLDVADDVCPWNAGRWRLAADTGGATCERTEAPADLALSATELGAAYLGGASLTLLAAAGRVHERTPGALAAAGTAFKGAREPWCAAIF